MSGANDDEYNDDNNSNNGIDIQDNNNNYKDNKIFLFAKRLRLTKSKIKYLIRVFHDTGFLDNILFCLYFPSRGIELFENLTPFNFSNIPLRLSTSGDAFLLI